MINITENILWSLLNNIISFADDEKSIIKDDDLPIDNSNDIVPETSIKEDKSLEDVSKTIIKSLTGQGLNFNRIKIDENVLKKNILKVRYINSNRRVKIINF